GLRAHGRGKGPAAETRHAAPHPAQRDAARGHDPRPRVRSPGRRRLRRRVHLRVPGNRAVRVQRVRRVGLQRDHGRDAARRDPVHAHQSGRRPHLSVSRPEDPIRMMEEAAVTAAAAPPKAASGWRGVWAFIRASWLNALAVAIGTIVVLMAALGPLLLGGKANTADFAAILQGPSGAHWMGTDNVGRDLFARVVVGARISLASAALIVL